MKVLVFSTHIEDAVINWPKQVGKQFGNNYQGNLFLRDNSKCRTKILCSQDDDGVNSLTIPHILNPVATPRLTQGHWFSKGGSWTRSHSLTWSLNKNPSTCDPVQTDLWTYQFRNSGDRAQHCGVLAHTRWGWLLPVQVWEPLTELLVKTLRTWQEQLKGGNEARVLPLLSLAVPSSSSGHPAHTSRSTEQLHFFGQFSKVFSYYQTLWYQYRMRERTQWREETGEPCLINVSPCWSCEQGVQDSRDRSWSP